MHSSPERSKKVEKYRGEKSRLRNDDKLNLDNSLMRIIFNNYINEGGGKTL